MHRERRTTKATEKRLFSKITEDFSQKNNKLLPILGDDQVSLPIRDLSPKGQRPRSHPPTLRFSRIGTGKTLWELL